MASGSVFRDNFYTHAIVGVVKSTIAEEAAHVDMHALRYQHAYLVRILRDMEVDVIEVDFHGPYTGSLLLDRVAVSVNGVVYMPTPKSDIEEYNVSHPRKLSSAKLLTKLNFFFIIHKDSLQ